MKNTNRILLLIISIFLYAEAVAAPLMQGITMLLNGDGKYIEATVRGDEFFSYVTSKDGYLITMGKGGDRGFYVYAYTNEKGEICATKERVGYENKLTKTPRKRQLGIPSHIIDMASVRRRNITTSQYSGLLNNVNSGNPTVNAPLRSTTTKDIRGIVLLVEFPDLEMTYDNDNFNRMLNQKGYSDFGGTGSASEYFESNANSKYTFSFDVSATIMVSKPFAYYGADNEYGYDSYPAELCVEAANLAATEQGIDFTQYDQNNDGYVDFIFMVYAGHATSQGASSDHIWPHKGWINEDSANGMSIVINGKTLRDYACTSELKGSYGTNLDGIGTFCHEFSHVLGLADTYDTDSKLNGSSVGMGNYSIMSSGTYNNSANTPPYYMYFERVTAGFIDCDSEVIVKNPSKLKTFEIRGIEHNEAVIIPTKTEGLNYYIELREQKGSDKHLPGEGVIVYLIDTSDEIVPELGVTAKDSWWDNKPNANPYHMCADIIKANGDNSEGEWASSLKQRSWVYPYRENDAITPSTKPSSINRYNENDYFYLTNIKYDSAKGIARFTLGEPIYDLSSTYPFISIKIPSGGLKSGSILELIDSENQTESVEWYVDGKLNDGTLQNSTYNEIKAIISLKTGGTEILLK